jgi:peptidoglycan/LPS O-acetylase OafA/YrhL
LNGSLWTIPVELGFYLSLPILYAILMNRTSRLRADICLALIAMASFAYWFYLSSYADLHGMLTKMQMVTPIPHLHMFLVGVLLQRHFERLVPYLENRAPYWFAAFAICMFSLNPWGKDELSPWPVSVAIGRLLLAMTVLSFAFSWRSLSERLLRGNDISYGVYLYHAFAINTLVQIGWKGEQWHLGLVVFCSTFLAFLSWRLIEQPAVSMKSARFRPRSEAPSISTALAPEGMHPSPERRAA